MSEKQEVTSPSVSVKERIREINARLVAADGQPTDLIKLRVKNISGSAVAQPKCLGFSENARNTKCYLEEEERNTKCFLEEEKKQTSVGLCVAEVKLRRRSRPTNVPISKLKTNVMGVSKELVSTNDTILELRSNQDLAYSRVCGSNVPKIAEYQKQQDCGCVIHVSQRRDSVSSDTPAEEVPPSLTSYSHKNLIEVSAEEISVLYPSAQFKKDSEVRTSLKKFTCHTPSQLGDRSRDHNVADRVHQTRSEDWRESYRVSFTLQINDPDEVIPDPLIVCIDSQQGARDLENTNKSNEVKTKDEVCTIGGEFREKIPTNTSCTLERPLSVEEDRKKLKDSASEGTYVSNSELNERSRGGTGSLNSESIFRESCALYKLHSHSSQVSSVSHFNEESSKTQFRNQSQKSPFDDILSSLEKICDEFEFTSADIHCENTEKSGDSRSHLESSGDVTRIFSDSTVSSSALSYLDKTKYCTCSHDRNTADNVPFPHSNIGLKCDNVDCSSLCFPEDFPNTNFEDSLKEKSSTSSKASHDFLCDCLELGLSFRPESFDSKSGDAKTQYAYCERKLNNCDNITFNDENKDALTLRFETRMDSRTKSSKYYTFYRGNRVKNKASKVQLIPNFHITTLTKVPPTATELEPSQASRSLPSTPLTPRANSQVRSKPNLPAYLTLGRKGGLRRGSEGYNHDILSNITTNNFIDELTESKDIKQIRTILAGLDFSKYRRGRSEEEIETKSKTSLSSNQIPENLCNDFKHLYRGGLFLSKFNETTKSFHGSLTEVKPAKGLDNIYQRSTSLLDSLDHNFQCTKLYQYQVNDSVNTNNIIGKGEVVSNSKDPGKFPSSTLSSRKTRNNQLQRTPEFQHKHQPHHLFTTMNHSKSPQSVSEAIDKNGNKKLKQLTEKLKSQYSSTVSSSPNFSSVKDSESSEPFGRKSPLVSRSSSFSHVDVTLEGGYVMSSDCSNRDSTYSLISGLATLPRKKITQLSSLSDKNRTSSSKPVQDNALISPRLELNQSDLLNSSIVDSIVDEGLVSDLDCPSYSHEYSSVTTSSSHSCDSKSLVSFIRSRTNTYSGDGTHSLPSEARKRRKGFRGHTVGFKLGSHESKANNGRLLTYPPQRRSSKSDDELEYTSVDSNGLKSLKTSPGLNLPLNEGPLHQTSDLSLADSHFSHSESFRDETYQDILNKVTGNSNHLTSEDRNVKALKKKCHSDPSRGNTGKNVHLPEIITTCNSESMLRNFDNSNEIQQPELIFGTKEPVSDDANLVLADLTNHQAKQGLGCSPPQTRLSGTDFDLDKEKLMIRSPQQQRRYSKKRLRGPYGEMLEEEMRKSGEKVKTNFAEELSFLQELSEEKSRDDSRLFSECPSRPCSFSTSQSLDDTELKKSSLSESGILRRKTSANIPLVQSDSDSEVSHLSPPPISVFSSDPNISQSPSDLQVCENNATSWNQQQDALVFELKKESELTRLRSVKKHQDTRTHVVGELYDTEKSYVESLQILVNKYMKPLKSPENAGIVDPYLVDEIFHQIPEILVHHESFLEMLRQRLANWDTKQKVGDVFVDAFTKQHVIDTYTAFINNWKSAKDAIKLTTQAKPAFQKFLEHMAREHKGKLTLDALLIMPVQRIPRYELLIKELLKHTPVDHPDHQPLVLAQKEVHELAVQINRMEREAFQHEQMQQKIREIEHLIEGVMDLVQPDRTFIRYDLVTISGALNTKKERCIFLFSDLLIITSIKRKSGTIRKTSSFSTSPSSFGSLEMNKYKMLMRFSLDNLDIVKSADGSLKRTLKEVEHLEKDISVLGQINDLVSTLSCQHEILDEALQDLMNNVNKQLAEKQSGDSHLLNIELVVTVQEGVDTICIIFPTPEKKLSWEAAFNEAKQKLALSIDRRPPPEFLYPVPIRKTRAGLQFTCAAPTLGLNHFGLKDVWVCNSDGYVGQVCILSLQPEPTVTSCNGVCNARILCIASIPAANPVYVTNRRKSVFIEQNAIVSIDNDEVENENDQHANNGNFQLQLDSDSSDEDEEVGEAQDEDPVTKQISSSGSITVKEEAKEEIDNQQPTVWLGTEDGCIHIYNCKDNIRIKKNKIKIQHTAATQCIIYFDNRVFLSLANGELYVYRRSTKGGWNISEPQRVQIGSVSACVSRMLAVAGKLWCGCQNNIKILNTNSLEEEHCLQVSSDTSRAVLCLVTSGLGVWVAIEHSAVLRLFHATSYENLLDVNVAPAVTKMLAGCDDIIRQHKAACLRVTALLACKDLLWVGTSAGVILSLPLPHLTSSTSRLDNVPNVSGIPHGHTGHVRFLTCVEMTPGASMDASGCAKYIHRSIRSKEGGAASRRMSSTTSTGCRLLVISGGDGYEDFCHSGLSETAGRDDSTNHLLLWQV
ncbi:uncharacterized protein LOC143251577 [Tachypleus tridentatus]|uniref:uncharacterized protein LOC143251577 n=1 Tax=Tachypleus tridentatus TaxID=6853 RepID=UPI003FD2A332